MKAVSFAYKGNELVSKATTFLSICFVSNGRRFPLYRLLIAFYVKDNEIAGILI